MHRVTSSNIQHTYTQKDVNAVWKREWSIINVSNVRDFFTQRLFVEGYARYKTYLPKGTIKILDVGGGTGRYGIQFARDNPDAAVVISDVLEESLAVGRKIAQELNVRNVTFVREDINTLSHSDETFDVVLCDAVIQHLPSVRNAMKEMRRVLRNDGILIVSTMNTWNIHTFVKHFLRFTRKGYKYGYEKSYRPQELKDLFFSYHLDAATDGFFPTYGLYRLKAYIPGIAFVAKLLNRATKVLDTFMRRFFSKQFGFEIFAVGKKWNMTVKRSGVLTLPAFEDARGGVLISSEFEKHIPFPVKRMYYITGLSNGRGARGNHAHRTLSQAIFCIQGKFRLTLDDGERQQKIWLRNPSYGVLLGPMLWHAMGRFSKDCVIMVLASDRYDESDYIRSYDEFKKYIAKNI